MFFRLNIFWVACILAIVSVACTKDIPGNSGAPIVNSPQGAKGGEILVKFRPEISDLLDDARTRAGRGGAMTRSGISTLDALMDVIGGYELERIFPVDTRHEERTRDAGLHLWYTVRFDKNTAVEDVAARLSQLGEVAKVEYNREIKRTYTGKSTPLVRPTPRADTRAVTLPFNDPDLDMQWHYINSGDNGALGTAVGTMVEGRDVNVAQAWALCTGDPSIVVAVMDEGVDWSHEDLSDNIWINPNEVYKSYTDNDGNGYEGDVYGFNFADYTGVITWDAQQDTGHGTHVAGTIAAVNNNGAGASGKGGVSGIAGGDGTAGSGVKIMSIQIFAGATGITIPNEARAIKYAADNGAVILQCSWGYISALANEINYGSSNGLYDDEKYSDYASLEKEAFQYFIYNAGSPTGVIDGGLVIFASGNEYAPMAAYPGAYHEFVCVSALDGHWWPALYTNFGPGVDISAPGGDGDYHQSEHGNVLSTLPKQHGTYGYMEGTSMACPHVSGVAALGLSYAAKLHKRFNSREYKQLLLDSYGDLDAVLTGKKNYYEGYSEVEGGNTSHPAQMDLGLYRGKMGVGVIDAGKLLTAIGGGTVGAPITLPNVFVAVGASKELDVTLCFAAGASVTAAASGDTSIATVSVESGKVLIAGAKPGSTSFTVTAGGQTQTAYVTVRKAAEWLR